MDVKKRDELVEKSADMFAKDIRSLYMALHNRGFTWDESFECIKSYIHSCGFAYNQNIYEEHKRRKGDILR